MSNEIEGQPVVGWCEPIEYTIRIENLDQIKEIDRMVSIELSHPVQLFASSLNKSSAALMEDRVLMYQSKKQIYGTQSSFRSLENGKSEYFIWPVENPEEVNERRAAAGLDSTVEKYAKGMNAVYNPNEPLVSFGSTF